jgi:hypothetical protein
MNKDLHFSESDRVRRSTDPEILNRIDQKIEQNIRFYATQPPEVITRRIAELEHERDMERWLELNAAGLGLTGAFLGITSSRKWLLLTCGVMGFFLQHATTGWCPPVPAFRRLGVRTRGEIDREKFALKTLRGDFKGIPAPEEHRHTFTAAETAQSVTE